MTQQYKKATALTILCSILAFALVSFASASSTGTLNATSTIDSNSITLSGTGFDVNETVTLKMLNKTDSTVIHNFAETATTDSDGAFTINVTLPSGYYGEYNITAETSSISAYDTYTISDVTSLTASPENSNIINVVGTGFNAEENVTLELNNAASTVYTFSEIITTNDQGSFNATVIIPTSLSGSFTLTAATSTTSANTTIAVPDLTGPTGATGATGATGETGEKGTPADTTIIYFALVVSIAAIVVAIITLLKKH
jgi:hypothetical protein